MSFRHFLDGSFRFLPHRRKAPRPARKPSCRPMLEELESRWVPSDFSLGTLAGRTLAFDTVDAAQTNNYSFVLSTPANLNVQLITEGGSIGGRPDLDIVLRQQGSPSSDSLAFSAHNTDLSEASTEEQFSRELPAGNYVVSVVNQETLQSVSYDLAFAPDPAQAASVTQNGTFVGFKDGVGHEFGSLTESPGVDSAVDFVGHLYSFAAVKTGDLEELYTYDVPRDGRVTINVNGLTDDPSGAPIDIQVELYRDSDRDGLFEPGESLNSAELVDATQSYGFIGTLSTGRYALALTSAATDQSGDVTGGSNYCPFRNFITIRRRG
jgi:hypothetical protein